MMLRPRLGPFGPYRTALIIGVPLLQAMPVSELRAVVAHELAHLARHHGRFDPWIYRLRQAYPALLGRLEERGWVVIVARAFLDNYGPYFNLYTLALARAHEYEADRIAAAITSPDIVAAALHRSALLQRFTEHQARLRVAGGRDGSDLGYRAATNDEDEILADHPSLEKRLAALGAAERPLPAVGVSAATALLPQIRFESPTDAWHMG
jgi:Zn-dependent protease with chaperone function